MSIADKGWKSSRGLHRTAHQGTALGDVGTVADLFAAVRRPIAEQRGLETREQLAAYAAEEWYPSRIAFGQHKGRSIAERCVLVAGAFKPRTKRDRGYVAERRVRRVRWAVIGQASLRDAGGW